MRDKRYKTFANARLEEEITDWMKKERKAYMSWNMFFRELIERYKLYGAKKK